MVKFEDGTGKRIGEGPRVVGPREDGEALQLQEVHRLPPPVQRQQVDIRHRTIALALIKVLAEGRSLERKRRGHHAREH